MWIISRSFNDTHGHDVGDEVLKLVASRLRKVTGGGKAYRYGGEEFTVVFPGKTVEECLPHLEALRLAVENYPLQLRDKHSRPGDAREGRQRRAGGKSSSVSVTMSIGVAGRTAGAAAAGRGDQVCRSGTLCGQAGGA